MSRQQAIKTVLGLLLLSGILTALHSVDLTPNDVQSLLRESGPWGPIFFVIAFTVLQSLAVSAHIFIIAANFVWAPETAIFLSWLGSMGSGLLSFFFARYGARDWVQARIPDKIKKYDQRLEKSGLLTVIILRLIFFTSPPIQLGLGISSVRFRPFLVGTALANIPTIVVVSFASDAIIQWFQSNPEKLYLAAIVIITLIVGSLLGMRALSQKTSSD